MATHICTHCHYEGSPVRPPSDGAGEEDSFLVGIVNKLIFATTFIPFKINWIIRLAQRGKVKNCPNCGLPLMVKLKSDAGWITKRKADMKSGLRFEQPEKPPAVGFGKEIILPGDEEKNAPPPVPKLESLPSLDAMMQKKELPDADSSAADKKAEPSAPLPVKKPVDPDVW